MAEQQRDLPTDNDNGRSDGRYESADGTYTENTG